VVFLCAFLSCAKIRWSVRVAPFFIPHPFHHQIRARLFNKHAPTGPTNPKNPRPPKEIFPQQNWEITKRFCKPREILTSSPCT
jgi:hypothetical protein